MLAEVHAPMGSFLPCIIWFVMPIWTVVLVHKMIMSELDTLTGLLAIGTGMWLGFLAWNPPAPWVEPVAILSVFAMMVGIPVAQRILEKHSDRILENEQAEIIYEQLRANPQNSVAVFRLAKLCYAKGLAGHAIMLGQTALTSMPRNVFREEHREYAQWVGSFGSRMPAPVACLKCNSTCHPGQIYCPKCWAPFLLQYLHGGASTPGGVVRKVVVVWVALVVVIFAVPALNMFGPAIVIPISAAVLGLCAWAIFSAFTDVVKTA